MEDENKRFNEYCSRIYSHISPFLQSMGDAQQLARFKQLPPYHNWSTSKHSCMLILCGHNHHSTRSASWCWLSPVAIDVISSFRNPNNNDHACAYYVLGLRSGDLVPQVLSAILLQLLESNRSALHRDEAGYTELCNELREYQKETSSGGRHSHLKAMALRTLNMLGSSGKTIYIVLDRVELCQVISDEAESADHREKILEIMVYLVEEAQVRLRVLAVVNALVFPLEGAGINRTKKERVIIYSVKQETLSK